MYIIITISQTRSAHKRSELICHPLQLYTPSHTLPSQSLKHTHSPIQPTSPHLSSQPLQSPTPTNQKPPQKLNLNLMHPLPPHHNQTMQRRPKLHSPQLLQRPHNNPLILCSHAR